MGTSATKQHIKPINQFPVKLVDFSSQYGSQNSTSYNAINIVGEPSVYPKYGDYTDACVLRYYGTWWTRVPSKPPPVGNAPNCYPANYCSQDFIVVEYTQPVHLLSVRVYETFVPGCVVKIFVQAAGECQWHLVWRADSPQVLPHSSRIFEPDLTLTPAQPVNRVRLEFNSSAAEYYTELDTVELIGYSQPPRSWQSQMRPKRVRAQSAGDVESIGVSPRDAAGIFGSMPPELVYRVLELLDIESLLATGSTCRMLRTFCYDPLLYRSLSLRPYCLRVTDQSLVSLMSRTVNLREFDLSWCGGDDAITCGVFTTFVHNIEAGCLRTLRLANCRFVDDECLSVVTKCCRALTDLDLSGCVEVTAKGYYSLASLKELKRLNLYRCKIKYKQLLPIIASNSGLQHLNIGSCRFIDDCDAVACALADSCPGLVSADFWRCTSLTNRGLVRLADGCRNLLELDLGWCGHVDSSTSCFVHLTERCSKLEKLFLTANRTVSDDDLRALAKNCKSLRQLDILGTGKVSYSAIVEVLRSCPKLEMFDVSFCRAVNKEKVHAMRVSYPNCAIQMSFQAEN